MILETLAYAAGIMDGEGSIQITKQKNSCMACGYRYNLLIAVSNTKQELCQWLKDNFGGSCFPSGKTKADNVVWHWQLGTLAAEKFLLAVYPYLILKKAKADVALTYRNMIQPRSISGRRLTIEEWNEIEHLRMKIREV